MTILELAREAGDARRAVALADQVLGRAPASPPRDEDVDPVRQVGDVGLDAEELLAVDLVVEHPGEAGVGGIDVDDVRDVEDRVRVVAHPVGLHRVPLVVDHELLRTGVAEVHPERPGARPAVEGDEDRAALEVGDVGALVVGVVERGDGLAVLVVDRLRAGRHPVGHPHAADRHFGRLGEREVRLELAPGEIGSVGRRGHLVLDLVLGGFLRRAGDRQRERDQSGRRDRRQPTHESDRRHAESPVNRWWFRVRPRALGKASMEAKGRMSA